MGTIRHLTYFLLLSLMLLSTGCNKSEDEDIIGWGSAQKQATSYYGDLSITTILYNSNLSVLCLMSLSGVEVGAQVLIPSQNTYNFDLQLANCYAHGALTFSPGNAQQLSKVSGDFEYSSADNNQSFVFKVDIIYWFTDVETRNSTYGDIIIIRDTSWIN